ncbi:MAG TPA: hypothetical protein P5050_07100 [Bacteroidia bacterium]|nr:hypothetical protein [Sphingobacteriales bacterium]HPD65660.1 hypothetical protein [Bacteroidia bacterium]HRS58974.1 hypothetical protein [Bacteroidia bacterium]HRU67537.1 hypothetical protein [Bacteroidia bacterium]
MKKSFILLGLLSFMCYFSYAQHITDETSKSYYDEAKTKLKEVYSFIEVNTFSEKGDNQIVGKTMKKHGPYFYYYENGKLKIQGNYKYDKKHGTWLYYDDKGNLLKTEEYKDGELILSK